MRPPTPGAQILWVPTSPMRRRVDADLRVLSEEAATVTGICVDSTNTSVSVEVGADEHLDVIIWRLAPPVAEELAHLSSLETQQWFLWGSHTRYARPGDVFAHLINGAVYERHFAWPHRRKICSENDAHALYVTLCGLERATGKRIYRFLKEQILLCVLSRQSPDGGFRHGEWTDDMEAHLRLHASAMHLLMDALAERHDPALRDALRRGIAFLASHRDQTDVGTWFLHDDLERSEASMGKAPAAWLPSRAFGKSSSNMLVLNTHLDTTVALDRYSEVTGDQAYAPLVDSARRATRAVLAQRPAEWLYRIAFSAVGLTLLPSARGAALPLPLRAVKRLAWKYLIPNFYRLKTRFPRLVMPGGYIDRDVSLKWWAHHYLTINLMDLLRYTRRFRDDDVVQIIEGAVAFARTSGILDRWQELRYEKYALGFWAEALYHRCTLSKEPADRAQLADAVLRLEDSELGLPPSLLGANCEAVPFDRQVPSPGPEHHSVRVVNLSSVDGPEYLVVNTAHEPLRAGLAVRGQRCAKLSWRGPDGQSVDEDDPLVAPRSWLIARP